MERWFNTVKQQLDGYEYNPKNIWNMDESGFAVGEEQAMKVLIHLDNIQKYKVVAAKQEWVTDIEYINTAGEALAPFLIFKGKYMNTRWINEQTSNGWYFATSKNGWTSNDLGLEWLIKVFELLTCEKAAEERRLLIYDGHGNHIQGDFLAYCIQNAIDLLVMPFYCSHIL